MKNVLRILPIVAVFLAIGFAIYHVTSQQPVRVEPTEVAKAASAPASTAPQDGRYANPSTATN